MRATDEGDQKWSASPLLLASGWPLYTSVQRLAFTAHVCHNSRFLPLVLQMIMVGCAFGTNASNVDRKNRLKEILTSPKFVKKVVGVHEIPVTLRLVETYFKMCWKGKVLITARNLVENLISWDVVVRKIYSENWNLYWKLNYWSIRFGIYYAGI